MNNINSIKFSADTPEGYDTHITGTLEYGMDIVLSFFFEFKQTDYVINVIKDGGVDTKSRIAPYLNGKECFDFRQWLKSLCMTLYYNSCQPEDRQYIVDKWFIDKFITIADPTRTAIERLHNLGVLR